jgi:hypothetical protein
LGSYLGQHASFEFDLDSNIMRHLIASTSNIASSFFTDTDLKSIESLKTEDFESKKLKALELFMVNHKAMNRKI